jgi:hypothetical protein
MTNADKADKMAYALKQLGAEYSTRPDVLHAIREFMYGVGPAQLCLLYDLVQSNDTPKGALESLGVAR